MGTGPVDPDIIDFALIDIVKNDKSWKEAYVKNKKKPMDSERIRREFIEKVSDKNSEWYE